MNIVLEFLSFCKAGKFVTENQVPLPLARAFMDDLCIMSSSVNGAQLALDGCCKVLDWAGMSFKASKSRSIVVLGGRVETMSPFTVGSSKDQTRLVIPSVTELPVKFLGRVIHGSLSDKQR